MWYLINASSGTTVPLVGCRRPVMTCLTFHLPSSFQDIHSPKYWYLSRRFGFSLISTIWTPATKLSLHTYSFSFATPWFCKRHKTKGSSELCPCYIDLSDGIKASYPLMDHDFISKLSWRHSLDEDSTQHLLPLLLSRPTSKSATIPTFSLSTRPNTVSATTPDQSVMNQYYVSG
jgi:hypothetical protein